MARKYLIVGGSSGIGFGIVKQLMGDGDEVIAVSRNEGALSEISGVTHIDYDVTGDEEIALETDALDGLVYCPGSINLKPFHRLKKSDFREDFDINVVGAVNIVQQALPLLKKGTSPSIVFFSTVAVGQGMSFHASTASAKAAVEGLSKSLAAELAPNIRVNCIAPSIVDTPLASRILGTPEKKESSAKRHPLNSVGEVEDIASMATFLLSAQSKWMTGQIIGIDGGMSSIKSMS